MLCHIQSYPFGVFFLLWLSFDKNDFSIGEYWCTGISEEKDGYAVQEEACKGLRLTREQGGQWPWGDSAVPPNRWHRKERLMIQDILECPYVCGRVQVGPWFWWDSGLHPMPPSPTVSVNQGTLEAAPRCLFPGPKIMTQTQLGDKKGLPL